MKYYYFVQSNPGGFWQDGISQRVVVEAHNAEEANARAEEIGIYFDGVDNGEDCECCGDRWAKADDYDELSAQELDDEAYRRGNLEIYRYNGDREALR